MSKPRKIDARAPTISADQIKKIIDYAVSSKDVNKALSLYGESLSPEWVEAFKKLTPTDLASAETAKKKLPGAGLIIRRE